MGDLIRDFRHALRALRKEPGFAAAAVLTLGLAVGLNVLMFTVVNGVLLRPLPYAAPEELLRLWGTQRATGADHANISPQDFLDWRAESDAFQGMAAYTGGDATLTGAGDPVRLRAARVTPGYFSLLGTAPALGRGFSAEEGRPRAAPAVILSDELWRARFSADPAVVGRAITLDGGPVMVVGVLPRTFTPPPYGTRLDADYDLYRALAIGPENGRGGHWLSAIGRLAPGATLSEAQAELDAIAARLEADYPDTNTGWGVRLEALRRAIVGDVRPALLILFAAVTLVLLIAAANLSNLMLIHAAGKRHDLAVRAALGAGRRRLLRFLLSEGMALGALGGALGLLLALWSSDALVALAEAGLPRMGEFGPDARVIAFTVVLSLGVGLVLGLVPLRGTFRADLVPALREGGRGGARRSRLRGPLVVYQLALSTMLLVGAGLLLRSFDRLSRVDPGFDREGVLTFELFLPPERYPERARTVSFFAELGDRLSATPEVRAAGGVSILPFRGASCDGFEIEGRPWHTPEAAECAEFRVVSGEYLRAMGIATLRGRTFDEGDRGDAAAVAVINQTMARRFWPDQDPIGRRVVYGEAFEIVGVIADIRGYGLDEEPAPEVYLPHPQYPFYRSLTMAVSAVRSPGAALPVVRRELRAMDPDLPLNDARPLSELLSASIATERLRTVLFGIFAALAVALAAVGVYGVIAYSVAQRTREIGVRLALGARAGDVLGQVLRDGMRLTLAGAALGLAGTLLLSPLLAGLLFQVSVRDPLVFAAVTATLVAVALTATLIPGRRASRVDPVEALRYE